MHHSNDVMVVQMSQLGQIESLKAKVVVQDNIIGNLVSDNLNHLQLNMQFTVYIDRNEQK